MTVSSDITKIIVLGAGQFAEKIADYLLDVPGIEIEAFVEGINRARCGKTIMDIPVVWIDDAGNLDPSALALCAVGSTKRKDFIEHAVSMGLKFTRFTHPEAYFSKISTMDQGTIICVSSVVSCSTRIGSHVIVNTGCLVGHHVEIGDYVTLSPGANIAGRVKIGNRTYVGMGAMVLEDIVVGENVIIGAGAVVTHDVPDSVQVVGVPARIVKGL